MIFEAADFVFEPPREIAFARRVLIKPNACCSKPHPVTTSRETLQAIIKGIKKVSGADIILLDRSSGSEPMHTIFKELGYNFPQTILLDVDQAVSVAVENPLPKPFAYSTLWVPNVILSCDFLITISPFKVVADKGDFCIRNLLGLLPAARYRREITALNQSDQQTMIDNLIADLYFTLPFDLGIVDGRKKLTSTGDPAEGDIEEVGKIFVGRPYEADYEASQYADISTPYLRLIKTAEEEQRRLVDDNRER